MQLLSDLGTNLSGITIDCLTAAEDDVLGTDANLVDGSSQNLAGSEGIGTAKFTARNQDSAVSAAGQQLTQHAFGRRGTHGDDHNLAAGGVLQLEGGLQGVQVIRVGDGCHRSTVEGPVRLDSNLAGGIRNLLDTNNRFHCTIALLTSAARPR